MIQLLTSNERYLHFRAELDGFQNVTAKVRPTGFMMKNLMCDGLKQKRDRVEKRCVIKEKIIIHPSLLKVVDMSLNLRLNRDVKDDSSVFNLTRPNLVYLHIELNLELLEEMVSLFANDQSLHKMPSCHCNLSDRDVAKVDSVTLLSNLSPRFQNISHAFTFN